MSDRSYALTDSHRNNRVTSSYLKHITVYLLFWIILLVFHISEDDSEIKLLAFITRILTRVVQYRVTVPPGSATLCILMNGKPATSSLWTLY